MPPFCFFSLSYATIIIAYLAQKINRESAFDQLRGDFYLILPDVLQVMDSFGEVSRNKGFPPGDAFIARIRSVRLNALGHSALSVTEGN